MSLPKLVFQSLEPVQQEVDLAGVPCLLVELDVPGVAEYKNAVQANFVLGPEGSPQRVTGSGDLDPLLVRLSLRKVLGDGKLGKFIRAEIDAIHPTVVRQLADAAREINPALDEKPTVEWIDKQIERWTRIREKLVAGEDVSKN